MSRAPSSGCGCVFEVQRSLPFFFHRWCSLLSAPSRSARRPWVACFPCSGTTPFPVAPVLVVQGVSAAFTAAAGGYMEPLQVLVGAGADVNLCAHANGEDDSSADGHVVSPLRLPSRLGPGSASADTLAMTPLQAAAAAGHAPAVAFLANTIQHTAYITPYASSPLS